MRPIASLDPPAAKGTTKVIERLGPSCATPCAVAAKSATTGAIIRMIGIAPPLRGRCGDCLFNTRVAAARPPPGLATPVHAPREAILGFGVKHGRQRGGTRQTSAGKSHRDAPTSRKH